MIPQSTKRAPRCPIVVSNSTLPFPPGPQPALQPQAVRSSACQEHTSLHGRLDAVEKVQFVLALCPLVAESSLRSGCFHPSSPFDKVAPP